ncbi:peptidoglycan editing factor PgeF [Glaesserella parasuis]|uniref:peptidoglycan editing factor PgeF n=1 Tax=Glaesserella parasuis TaxID=738 RepID=UPI0002C9C2CC|nr:peptidoglycan editing factor PgeF [Glaesserella parasuis]EMY46066.1 tRNA (5-methylaminomethyl-2-thiouridylate)-methyltransferase [Glaesserella parasuis gx033]MCT8559496.1 peptidoglycan editing factor PgeF [Glaesserella parasuis]MCT8581855.1 peptidoglycan editing factor PgeF [Glaesserella parasuis]MCT8586234.1 peptidoglycan editing factor PgeF [Glaesserella parasuis]MDD2155711.1 peptidoglycan editing factor PgeF [Glaesserella parasuis]
MKKILPTWSVPDFVHAFTTTREGGVSQAPFDSLNLGDHVTDDPQSVQTNREILQEQGNLPHFPLYLTQTHSTRVLRLPYEQNDIEADAVYTNQANQVCLVMTADCLPVLFCSKDGKEIAAAHAGWRGLCDGVLEATVAEFECKPENICVWLGPAIGPTAFQVGEDVIEQFCAFDPQAREAFVADEYISGKFLGNLYQIARQRLNKLGITEIAGGDYCTYCDAEQFFSYRRDKVTGRMATLIWRSE